MELPVVKIRQNNLEFYLGSFKIVDFQKFAKYTELLIIGFTDEGKPVYNNEVQRKTDNSKTNRISDFLIYNDRALFPTNIVVGVPMEMIELINDKNNNQYEIILDENFLEDKSLMTIIDGQHRVRGIEKALERLRTEEFDIDKDKAIERIQNMELVVTFFIAPTLDFQASIFSTINRTQKKVTESLVYSLFGLSKVSSPFKSALDIALELNSEIDNPFYDRIKLYGGNYKRGESPPLTQATVVKSIVKMISKNFREAEKEQYLKREELKVDEKNKLPFRSYYIQNRDSKIKEILTAFFSAVENSFLSQKGEKLWKFEEDQNKPTNILQTTVGFTALINILADLLVIIDESYYTDQNVYEEILSTVKDIDFTNQESYPFTAKTKSTLTKDIQRELISFSDNFYEAFIKKLGLEKKDHRTFDKY